jgi:hypothetical protein
MNQVLQGVIRGRTIELEANPGIEDGRQVEVVLRTKQLPGPPPGWKPDCRETAAGMLANVWTDEDDQLFTEIHQERKREGRPEIPE